MIEEYFDPLAGLQGPTEPVEFTLVGEDGNAFFIMGRLSTALKRAGASKEYVDAVLKDMQSGDYNHLLVVAMNYVGNRDWEEEDEEC